MRTTSTLIAHGAKPFRISDREFALFKTLVEDEVGIHLPESKRPLLISRLSRRLRVLRLDSFEAYYRRITREADKAERVRMIDLISTNVTRFFRQQEQFDFLERRLLPAWEAESGKGRRRVRIWSTACATGEEPYSIGMTLLSALRGWEIEILATDLSTLALEKARSALWPIEKCREIPERYLKAFMLYGTGERRGYMKAGRELRRLIRFEQLNLCGPDYDTAGSFDLIFCRNVLIYFKADERATVTNRLIERLTPGGCLFLGHAESLNGVSDRLSKTGPNAYSRVQLKSSDAGAGMSALNPR